MPIKQFKQFKSFLNLLIILTLVVETSFYNLSVYLNNIIIFIDKNVLYDYKPTSDTKHLFLGFS